MGHSDPTDVEWYEREPARVTVGGPRPLSTPIEIVDYRPEWPRLHVPYADAKSEVVQEVLARAEAGASTETRGDTP